MTMSSAHPRASAHISGDRLELLRSLLLCQLAEYVDRAAGSHAAVETLVGQNDVDSLLERELAETSANHFDSVVTEARDALQRIEVGAYGMCEVCDTQIPYERLEALPSARRCVTCPDPAARSPL